MTKMRSHTPEEKKLWHAGKRRPGESLQRWYHRVIFKYQNFKGAYHPQRRHLMSYKKA